MKKYSDFQIFVLGMATATAINILIILIILIFTT